MQRNESIRGLRGLAILMVFVLHEHQAVQTGHLSCRLAEDSPLVPVLLWGHRGVELFFMISGYLIVASLIRHQSAAQFLAQRIVRIYPAFLLPHLLIFAAGRIYGYHWIAQLDLAQYVWHFSTNLLMLPGYFEMPIANLVAWSLSLEMVFYLMAAAAFALAHSRLPPAVRILAWLVWLPAAAISLHKHPRAWFFLAGAAVYWFQRRSTAWQLPVVGRRVSVGKAAYWLRQRSISLPSRLGAVGLALPSIVLMCVLSEQMLPAAVVCGLAAFAVIAGERDPFCRLLRTRVFLYLGDISYSFYLWHIVLIMPLKRLFGGTAGLLPNAAANTVVFLVVSTLVSLLVADLSYRLVEQWFTDRYLRPRFEGRSPRAKALWPAQEETACVARGWD